MCNLHVTSQLDKSPTKTCSNLTVFIENYMHSLQEIKVLQQDQKSDLILYVSLKLMLSKSEIKCWMNCNENFHCKSSLGISGRYMKRFWKLHCRMEEGSNSNEFTKTAHVSLKVSYEQALHSGSDEALLGSRTGTWRICWSAVQGASHRFTQCTRIGGIITIYSEHIRSLQAIVFNLIGDKHADIHQLWDIVQVWGLFKKSRCYSPSNDMFAHLQSATRPGILLSLSTLMAECKCTGYTASRACLSSCVQWCLWHANCLAEPDRLKSGSSLSLPRSAAQGLLVLTYIKLKLWTQFPAKSCSRHLKA